MTWPSWPGCPFATTLQEMRFLGVWHLRGAWGPFWMGWKMGRNPKASNICHFFSSARKSFFGFRRQDYDQDAWQLTFFIMFPRKSSWGRHLRFSSFFLVKLHPALRFCGSFSWNRPCRVAAQDGHAAAGAPAMAADPPVLGGGRPCHGERWCGGSHR